jgi:hypothetical protein
MDRREANERLRLRVLTMAYAALIALGSVVGGAAVLRWMWAPPARAPIAGGDDGSAFVAAGATIQKERAAAGH